MTAKSDPGPAGRGPWRYAPVAIGLHWLIAAAIVLQVILAGRMGPPRTPETFAITQLHKSVGITILLLSLLRLAWRLTHPPAPLPATMAPWEAVLAKITHVGFYLVMIAMPLTGWLMVSTSRIVLPTLLYGVVPWPDIPGLAGLAPAAKHTWHQVGEVGHGALAKLIYVLLALHVAGALKHQLFSREEPVLARMAPGAVPGRWWEPRLLAIALGAVAVIVFGKLVAPPHPAMAPAPAAAPVTVAAPAQAPSPVVEPGPPPPAPPSGQPAPPSDDLSRWTVAKGSTLAFATAWSGEPVEGRFERWEADILFGPAALERSRVSVSIDMASARTGDAQRDTALPSADWFDATGHPTARFTATRFEQTGAGRYVAHGALTLRGVKKPLDLPFRLTISGDAAKMSGTASLDRTVFGVGQGEFASTDQIPAKVTVRIELQAKQSAAPKN